MEELRLSLGRNCQMQAFTDFFRRHAGLLLEVMNAVYGALKRRRGQPR